jgi:hypothetical protein
VVDCGLGVLASGVVDRGFMPRCGQTRVFEIGICSPVLSTQI